MNDCETKSRLSGHFMSDSPTSLKSSWVKRTSLSNELSATGH
jgi:hypothetical protein